MASYADYYGLVPGSNDDPVAAGDAIDFPVEGANDGGNITSNGSDTLTVADAGTYLVLFEAAVTGSSQLVLAVNGSEVASTTVGRTSGTGQIIGMSIQELPAGSTLQVRNPASANSSVTVTPTAGGEDPVSVHLIVIQLATAEPPVAE